MNDYLTKYQYKNTKTGQDPLSPLSSLSPLLSIFNHCLPLSLPLSYNYSLQLIYGVVWLMLVVNQLWK